MTAHRLRSAIRYAAEQAQEQWSHTRLGVRTSYDPVAHAVKVMLQPDGVETGWLPLKPLWQGFGWGFYAPPPAGVQCIVLFQEGHPDCGVCIGAIPSDQDRPLTVPDGEAWWQHQSGASVKLTNDQALTLTGANGASKVTLRGDGTIVSSGAWTHTGAFSATGEVTAMSQGVAVTLSTHTHPLQGPGAPITGQPLPE